MSLTVLRPELESLLSRVHKVIKSFNIKTSYSSVAVHYTECVNKNICNCTGFDLLHFGHKCGRNK